MHMPMAGRKRRARDGNGDMTEHPPPPEVAMIARRSRRADYTAKQRIVSLKYGILLLSAPATWIMRPESNAYQKWDM